MSDPSTNDAPDAAPDVEVHVDVDESAPAEPATDAPAEDAPAESDGGGETSGD